MGLQRYINQLLKDIEVATKNIPKPWYPMEEEADEEFGLLPWVEDSENAPTKSLEEWTNLKKEQFPPDNRLTDSQVSSLLCTIKHMLDVYNCSVVFQIDVPNRIQYRVIRDRFRQEVPMLKANYFFFEFCDKKDQPDRSQCLLGEKYCHCAFFEAFFEKFEDEQEESDYHIDPYEEYMLKRRYEDNWHKYIAYEEEMDFGKDHEDDDFDDNLSDEDIDDNLPF